MHAGNNNMKHKSFQGWYPRRERRQDLTLQQWDILSRSLNALMIVRDSFSANVYFKVNKNVVLMLQAITLLLLIRKVVGALPDDKGPVDIYQRLYFTVTIIRCCVASGWGSYLSASYGKIYICLCDSPIFCEAGYVRNTIWKERGWGKESISGTTALNIHVRGVVSKLYCLCILSIFKVTWSVFSFL